MVCGLGVGADLSRYCRHRQELDLADGCRNHTLRDVLALLARSCR